VRKFVKLSMQDRRDVMSAAVFFILKQTTYFIGNKHIPNKNLGMVQNLLAKNIGMV
jgi:hypothetical protein